MGGAESKYKCTKKKKNSQVAFLKNSKQESVSVLHISSGGREQIQMHKKKKQILRLPFSKTQNRNPFRCYTFPQGAESKYKCTKKRNKSSGCLSQKLKTGIRFGATHFLRGQRANTNAQKKETNPQVAFLKNSKQESVSVLHISSGG